MRFLYTLALVALLPALSGAAPVPAPTPAAVWAGPLAVGCGPRGVTLIRGPRGGCYYVTRGGSKEYVDRSCCR